MLTGYPLATAFQLYENYNFGKGRGVLYRCFVKNDFCCSNTHAASGELLQWYSCPDLIHTKEQAATTLYPTTTRGKCTLMFLSNLAEAELINVQCDKKLLSKVYCLQCTYHSLSNKEAAYNILQFQRLKTTCFFGFLELKSHCFMLRWYSSVEVLPSHIQGESCSFNNATCISEAMSILLSAMSLDNISVLIPTPANFTFQKITLNKLVKVTNFIQVVFTDLNQPDDGYFVFKSKKVNVMPQKNLFQCTNESFISILFVCDGQIDCLRDNTDEVDCFCDSSSNVKLNFSCKYSVDTNGSKSCGPLYNTTEKNRCEKYLIAKTPVPTDNIEKTLAKCNNGSSITANLWNDLVADCEDQSDEVELISLLQEDSKTLCSSLNMFPCKPGHSKCYNRTDICLFKIVLTNQLAPCRNGGHLQNCKQFDCGSRFKCWESYCIEWINVCDGKYDCTIGDDENTDLVCKYLSVCNFMFKCRGTNVSCINLNSVCDSNKDCPLADDEIVCELKSELCPRECHCLLFAMICEQLSYFGNARFHHVMARIHFSIVKDFQTLCRSFPNILVFQLQNNSISHVCTHECPHLLVTVNIAFNLLTVIKKDCFASPHNLQLQTLNLEHNFITGIEPHSFRQLSLLRVLKLSHNPLESFHKYLLPDQKNLKVVELKNTSTKYMHSGAFGNIDLSHIFFVNTDNFCFCCIAPAKSVCSAPPPWYISCSRLLLDKLLLLFHIMVSSLISCLGTASVAVQQLCVKPSNAYSYSVQAISLNDFFVAGYLGIIWIADLHFTDTFFLLGTVWRSSFVCFTASFTIMYVSLASALLLFFLSLARFMVVVQPVDSNYKRKNFTLKCIASLCVVSSLHSTAFSLVFAISNRRIPTDICLPLVDPLDSTEANVLTYLVMSSQCIISLAVCILHILLAFTVRKSHKKVGGQSQNIHSFTSLIVHLISMTLTNIICWYPANTVYVLALVWNKYPMGMVVWTTVLATPVNSLLNPTIFTISCVRGYLKEIQKLVHKG